MLLFLWHERKSLSLRMCYTEFGWNWPWLSKFKEDFKKDFNVLLLVRYYLPLKKRAWNCIWIIVLICGNWLRLSWEEVENEKFTEEETILEKFYRANQKSEKRWLIGWLIAYQFTFIYFKNISLVDNLSVKTCKIKVLKYVTCSHGASVFDQWRSSFAISANDTEHQFEVSLLT